MIFNFSKSGCKYKEKEIRSGRKSSSDRHENGQFNTQTVEKKYTTDGRN